MGSSSKTIITYLAFDEGIIEAKVLEISEGSKKITRYTNVTLNDNKVDTDNSDIIETIVSSVSNIDNETKKIVTFWQASVLDFSHPRRLHIAWIDVKLRQGVADTMRRRPMQKKVKTFHHRGFPGDSSA